jgi:hypothetical protein
VAEVSGTVVDSTTADPLGGATVVVRDGAGTTFRGTTDSAGGYRFTSSASQIRPGTLSVTASRDQYETSAVRTVEAKAGQSYTGIELRLRPAGAAGTSAGASGSAEPGVVTYSPGATVGARRDGGTSLASKVLIWFGSSLLALMLVAVAVIVVRRRLDRADPADSDTEHIADAEHMGLA